VYEVKLAEAFKKWPRIKDTRFPDVSQIQPVDVSPAPKPSIPVKDIVQEVPPIPKPEAKPHWLTSFMSAIVAFFKKG